MKILMVALALGVILMGGWLACDNQIYAETREVTIATDKTEYEQGESVKITLKNNFVQSIFSHIASGTPGVCIEYIERKTPAGDWEKLFTRCMPPHCIDDTDAPGEIKPGDSGTFEWKPLIYINGTQETINADSGTYRLVSLYQIRKGLSSEDWEWKAVRSNEFVIR